MSTITVAFILILIIICVALIFVFMNYKYLKKKQDKLLVYLSKLGTENKLSYTSQEVFPDKVIGLDGLQRKLLILEESNGRYYWNIIDLEEVEDCVVKKVYDSIKIGGLKKKRLQEYLKTIVLQFNFKKGDQSFDLLFYNCIIDDVPEREKLEVSAKKWQVILSKMLTKEVKKRA